MRFLSLLCLLLLALPQLASAQASVVIPVTSSAAHFSPGNWSGNAGRGGGVYRQTWNNGAYCTWTWTSSSANPTATLLISNQTPGSAISYYVDGHFVDNVAVPADATGILITGLSGTGPHTLTVYTRASQQISRWNDANAFKVTGLALSPDCTPTQAPAATARWALIIGDSITEGIAADNGQDDNLDDYSFLLGQALKQIGWGYCVSACGYSGWLRPGDSSGDVPPYYVITGSHDGRGGTYNSAGSRWNKIDDHTSFLDARGHLSAYGGPNEEPSAIIFNYGTNETLNHSNLSDTQASVTQSLAALRRAAPRAWICVLIPFGIENAGIYPNGDLYVQAIKAGVAAYQRTHTADHNVVCVDLGSGMANALASPPYGAAVHPNAAGHAFIASQVIPIVLRGIKRGK